ncbi:hypothetical protein WA026_006734 [Henosepilachna vigintioctopunctata]|uniref:Ionotropic receptor n=1 Tax=Henosepilachna vigintioctopunctata TaxID=420089 RepID=A0AAW1UEU2_9CUCU
MVSNYFKSRLTYLLNGLNYEASINTFEEIISSGLKIGATQDGADLINTSSKIAEYLATNYVNCRGVDCLRRTVLKKDLATIALNAVAYSRRNNFSEEKTGRILFNKLHSLSFRKPLCTFFNKGHPLYPLYDRSLQRLAESGILMKIYLKYVRTNMMNEPILNSTQSLNFGHMVAPLCMWSIGITLSVITFFYEIILAKRNFSSMNLSKGLSSFKK